MGSAPCHSRQPVYLGGPVPGPLMSLHTTAELAETEPVPGVFFAAKKQHLDELVLTEEPAYKMFVGHAGWGAGQLESELHQGAWRTMPATAEQVFSTDDDALGDHLSSTRPHVAEIDAQREGIAARSDGELDRLVGQRTAACATRTAVDFARVHRATADHDFVGGAIATMIQRAN